MIYKHSENKFHSFHIVFTEINNFHSSNTLVNENIIMSKSTTLQHEANWRVSMHANRTTQQIQFLTTTAIHSYFLQYILISEFICSSMPNKTVKVLKLVCIQNI